MKTPMFKRRLAELLLKWYDIDRYLEYKSGNRGGMSYIKTPLRPHRSGRKLKK